MGGHLGFQYLIILKCQFHNPILFRWHKAPHNFCKVLQCFHQTTWIVGLFPLGFGKLPLLANNTGHFSWISQNKQLFIGTRGVYAMLLSYLIKNMFSWNILHYSCEAPRWCWAMGHDPVGPCLSTALAAISCVNYLFGYKYIFYNVNKPTLCSSNM